MNNSQKKEETLSKEFKTRIPGYEPAVTKRIIKILEKEESTFKEFESKINSFMGSIEKNKKVISITFLNTGICVLEIIETIKD